MQRELMETDIGELELALRCTVIMLNRRLQAPKLFTLILASGPRLNRSGDTAEAMSIRGRFAFCIADDKRAPAANNLPG
jgi:hypothetical protein